jgi:hypothetical protein
MHSVDIPRSTQAVFELKALLQGVKTYRKRKSAVGGAIERKKLNHSIGRSRFAIPRPALTIFELLAIFLFERKPTGSGNQQ